MNIWPVTLWLLEITLRMQVCSKYLLKTLLSDRLGIYPEVRCCSTYIIHSQCHFHFSTLSVHALQAICSLLSSSLLSIFHLADENITGYLSQFPLLPPLSLSISIHQFHWPHSQTTLFSPPLPPPHTHSLFLPGHGSISYTLSHHWLLSTCQPGEASTHSSPSHRNLISHWLRPKFLTSHDRKDHRFCCFSQNRKTFKSHPQESISPSTSPHSPPPPRRLPRSAFPRWPPSVVNTP